MFINWFQNKKETKVKKPGIKIEIENDDSISVDVFWNKPNSPEETVKLAKLYAGFIYLLSSRDILPAITQALAIYGNNTNTSEVSSLILTMLNKALISDDKPERKKGNPVVRPRDAFRIQEND